MTDQPDAREETHEGDVPTPADPIAADVLARFPGVVFVESHGQPVLYVPREQWAEIARALRDDHDFSMCLDICAVDHLTDLERREIDGVTLERFEVVANFISHSQLRRIRMICEVPAEAPEVPSIIDIHPGIAVAERETFDLFGISFTGHDPLTRILMPDDWVGHPLRKDDAAARVPVTFKGDPAPR